MLGLLAASDPVAPALERLGILAIRGGVWAVALVVLLFLALPTLIVVPVSLNTSKYLDFPPEALTLRW